MPYSPLLLLALAAASAPATPSPAPSSAQASAPAEDARPRITLRWKTASEVDNYGFFVMRGDAEAGPFTALNQRVIPGAGNAEVPTHYTYEDFAVEPGRTYHYRLESVSTKGSREVFSPVVAKTCCTPPSPAPVPPPGQ